jgi:hypothetical protein
MRLKVYEVLYTKTDNMAYEGEIYIRAFNRSEVKQYFESFDMFGQYEINEINLKHIMNDEETRNFLFLKNIEL